MGFEIVSRMLFVLTINSHYLPGYRAGGPIRTLSNMVDPLGNELVFRIVTLDHDLGADESYRDVVQGEWGLLGKALDWTSPLSVDTQSY